MTKMIIRCKKVKDVFNINNFREFDPQKEQCENCKEDIWVTNMSRFARKSQQGNTITLCTDCANSATEHHLKTCEGGQIIHAEPALGKITIIESEEK